MNKYIKEYLINICLIFVSLFFLLCILEIGTRLYSGEYAIKNFLSEERTLLSSGYPSQFDRNLGWIPKEGYSGKKNAWKTEVTIKQFGIRSNGKAELPLLSSTNSVLAVGDSFTFGAEVSDHETWPAILERLTEKKVINGGVFGYGLDQVYLRAEQLIKIFHPEILIVSFIWDDIPRCQLSERSSIGKPYFDINQEELLLKNVPVPRPSSFNDVGRFRYIAGYSYFAHKFMMLTYPEVWLEGKKWHQTTKIHSKGSLVACLLLQKFARLAESNNIKKAYILIQDTSRVSIRSVNLVNSTLDCFEKLQAELLNIIDLRPELTQLRTNDRTKFDSLFFGGRHMTQKGNYFVAQKLQEFLLKN